MAEALGRSLPNAGTETGFCCYAITNARLVTRDLDSTVTKTASIMFNGETMVFFAGESNTEGE